MMICTCATLLLHGLNIEYKPGELGPGKRLMKMSCAETDLAVVELSFWVGFHSLPILPRAPTQAFRPHVQHVTKRSKSEASQARSQIMKAQGTLDVS